MAGHVRYTAALDACVLYSIAHTDALLSVAETGVYAPKWTQEIDRDGGSTQSAARQRASTSTERPRPMADPRRSRRRSRLAAQVLQQHVGAPRDRRRPANRSVPIGRTPR